MRRSSRVSVIDRWDDEEETDAAEGEPRVMELAAIKGDLDLIKWLKSQAPPCEWNKKACTAAAWANHFDLLRLLVSMGCPIEKEGMFGVVACTPHLWKGDLPDTDCNEKFEILKWLQREHGCVFGTSRTMEWFEEYHHIHRVVWAAGECSDFPSSAFFFSHH